MISKNNKIELAEKKGLDVYLTEEDKREFETLQNIKNNILKNLGIKNFINIVRDIIDESKLFEFTSAIKKKYINEITPIFTIRYLNLKIDNNRINDVSYTDNIINNIVMIINNDIIKKITDKMIEFMNTDENLKAIYSNLKEDLKGLLWSTVFEVKVSLRDNIIQMRYCI